MKTEELISKADELLKGDYPGHPFRGNQYGGSVTSGINTVSSRGGEMNEDDFSRLDRLKRIVGGGNSLSRDERKELSYLQRKLDARNSSQAAARARGPKGHILPNENESYEDYINAVQAHHGSFARGGRVEQGFKRVYDSNIERDHAPAVWPPRAPDKLTGMGSRPQSRVPKSLRGIK